MTDQLLQDEFATLQAKSLKLVEALKKISHAQMIAYEGHIIKMNARDMIFIADEALNDWEEE